METTGARIKAARIAAGLTQTQLAEKIGVKYSAIHKYESGLIVNLKRDTIEKLASALDVTQAYLLCIDDDEAIQGNIRPQEPVGTDVDALNVLLCEIGEHIIKVDGKYFLGECGQLSEDDIDFIKSSAVSGVRMAFDTLKKRAEKQMRDAISKQ